MGAEEVAESLTSNWFLGDTSDHKAPIPSSALSMGRAHPVWGVGGVARLSQYAKT